MSLARVKKGDLAVVTVGKDKGKSGKVLTLILEEGRVIVEKLNMAKHHLRPRGREKLGGILEKEAALQLSNVMPLCPKCNKPARVRVKSVKEKKIRICHRCGEALEVR